MLFDMLQLKFFHQKQRGKLGTPNMRECVTQGRNISKNTLKVSKSFKQQSFKQNQQNQISKIITRHVK